MQKKAIRESKINENLRRGDESQGQV
jgi:hypothetical protein